DLQRVDDQPELAHLVGGGAAGLAGEALTVEDEVLDGQVPDDRTQVAGEQLVDRAVHRGLLLQEPARRVRDRHEVVAHLVDHNAAHLDRDPLLGDAVDLEVGRAAVEPQPPGDLETGQDGGALARNDLESEAVHAVHRLRPGPETGNDQRFVRFGDPPDELEQHDQGDECADDAYHHVEDGHAASWAEGEGRLHPGCPTDARDPQMVRHARLLAESGRDIDRAGRVVLHHHDDRPHGDLVARVRRMRVERLDPAANRDHNLPDQPGADLAGHPALLTDQGASLFIAAPSAVGPWALPATGPACDRCIAPTRPAARVSIRFLASLATRLRTRSRRLGLVDGLRLMVAGNSFDLPSPRPA